MSRSIHTTRKALVKERVFAVRDDVPSADAMTELEREDIQKSIRKLNAKWKRQTQNQHVSVHAHLALGEVGLVRSVKRRKQP